MKGKGSAIVTCEACQERFRVAAGRKASARFCSWECNTLARHRGLVRPRPKTRHGALRVKPWAEQEIELLRREYFTAGPTALGRKLGRSKGSVQVKATLLGIVRQKPLRWSEQDEAWLRDHFSRYSWAALAKKLGRTETAIKLKADRLGIGRRDSAEWDATAVAAIFGIDRNSVLRWIDRGWLRAEKNKHLGSMGSWQIKPEAVRRFVQEHPSAFDVRKVDQISFIDLMLGVLTDRRGERMEREA